MKRPRLLILAAAMTLGAFAQASFADGDKTYPPFDTIAGGKKMLSREDINKIDLAKYPRLEGLKSHFDDADIDHDHTINKYEYDLYMSNKHG